ncbi:hypothetical protein Tco_1049268, partial [Tanacetum coccineum]
GQFARECKDRKSGTNEANAVNTEIAEMVAHVHLDDGDDLVAIWHDDELLRFFCFNTSKGA